jgi:hypothetical protein
MASAAQAPDLHLPREQGTSDTGLDALANREVTCLALSDLVEPIIRVRSALAPKDKIEGCG